MFKYKYRPLLPTYNVGIFHTAKYNFILLNNCADSVTALDGDFNIEDFFNKYINKVPYRLKSLIQINKFGPKSIEFLIQIRKDLFIRGEYSSVYIMHKYGANLDDIKKKMNEYKKLNDTSPKMNLITYENNEFKLKKVDVKKVDINIELLYGSDFYKKSNHLTQELKKSSSSISLLHGLPGTGKTNYIRSVIYELCINKKDVIYVSPSMIENISSPSFINFIVSNKDCVLIVEDAENIITSRDDYKNSSAIQNLLNMSDGLLGDILNMHIICTFNCPLSKVDTALKRKGRILIEHEFKPLSINQSNQVITNAGLDFNANKEMTLAEIFNHKDYDFADKERGSVGFKVG